MLPGDASTLLIVQRAGLVRRVHNGVVERDPFLDLRRLVSTRGEGGLLSIALDPRYARNSFVFVDYTDRHGDVNVAQYHMPAHGRPTRIRTLLRVTHRDSPYHNGGQLAFGPAGMLYVGVGDGGYLGSTSCSQPPCGDTFQPDPHHNAQNLRARLGKILKIDVLSGRIAVMAYGLRNPWRFSFDRRTDALYIADVGWNRAEEVDFVPRGTTGLLNFGWSVYEGARRRPHAGRLNRLGRLVSPALTYGHHGKRDRRGFLCTGSITGGYVYRGSAIPSLRGRYVYGDFCFGRVWSLRIVGGRATDVRLEPIRVPALVSFGEDAHGELYALSLNSRIYRLVPRGLVAR